MTKRVHIGTKPGDYIVGYINKDGDATTSLETAMWTDFLNGKWQKEKPTSVGVYPIANRQGKVSGEAMFTSDCEGNVFSVTHDNWDGWFFSRPMPQLPNRPPKQWSNAPANNTPLLRLVPNPEQ